MPTKKKRVGFIPREDVMEIIDKLSYEHNLSNSKIVNILVEEALVQRGIFNKGSVKESISYLENSNKNKGFQTFINNHKNNSDKLDSGSVPKRTLLNNQYNQVDFDLETYEKFILFIKFHEMINKFNI